MGEQPVVKGFKTVAECDEELERLRQRLATAVKTRPLVIARIDDVLERRLKLTRPRLYLPAKPRR